MIRCRENMQFKAFTLRDWMRPSHVTEHFGYHTGQIIYITKLKRAQDLRFTRLPVIKKKKGGR